MYSAIAAGQSPEIAKVVCNALSELSLQSAVLESYGAGQCVAQDPDPILVLTQLTQHAAEEDGCLKGLALVARLLIERETGLDERPGFRRP